ncbi:MAG: O-antigen ligase family protein [Pseudonocardia sp.]
MTRGGELTTDTGPAAPPHGAAAQALRRVASPAGVVALMVLLICVPLPLGGGAFPADALSGLLVVVVGIRALRDGLRLSPAAAVLFGSVVLAASIVALTGADAAGSFAAWARYLQLFALVPLAVVLSLRDRRDGELVAHALVLAGVVQGVASVVQVATGAGATFQGQNSRATGTFGAEDVIAASVIIGLAITVCVGLTISATGRRRFVYVVTAIGLLLPMGLTLSRGSWLSTAFALVVVLAFAGWRAFAATAVCGAAALVVLIGGFGVGSETIGARLASIGDTSSAPDPSTNDRYALWATAVDIWVDHPIAGVGLKEFPRYRDSYAPLDLSSGSTVGQSGGSGAGLGQQELLSPHNQYLLVLSEQGVLGFLPFAALLFVSTATAARSAWRGPRGARGLGAAIVGVSLWQLLQFVYGDLGGATSLVTSVVIGLAVWFGLERSAEVAP